MKNNRGRTALVVFLLLTLLVQNWAGNALLTGSEERKVYAQEAYVVQSAVIDAGVGTSGEGAAVGNESADGYDESDLQQGRYSAETYSEEDEDSDLQESSAGAVSVGGDKDVYGDESLGNGYSADTENVNLRPEEVILPGQEEIIPAQMEGEQNTSSYADDSQEIYIPDPIDIFAGGSDQGTDVSIMEPSSFAVFGQSGSGSAADMESFVVNPEDIVIYSDNDMLFGSSVLTADVGAPAEGSEGSMTVTIKWLDHDGTEMEPDDSSLPDSVSLTLQKMTGNESSTARDVTSDEYDSHYLTKDASRSSWTASWTNLPYIKDVNYTVRLATSEDYEVVLEAPHWDLSGDTPKWDASLTLQLKQPASTATPTSGIDPILLSTDHIFFPQVEEGYSVNGIEAQKLLLSNTNSDIKVHLTMNSSSVRKYFDIEFPSGEDVDNLTLEPGETKAFLIRPIEGLQSGVYIDYIDLNYTKVNESDSDSYGSNVYDDREDVAEDEVNDNDFDSDDEEEGGEEDDEEDEVDEYDYSIELTLIVTQESIITLTPSPTLTPTPTPTITPTTTPGPTPTPRQPYIASVDRCDVHLSVGVFTFYSPADLTLRPGDFYDVNRTGDLGAVNTYGEKLIEGDQQIVPEYQWWTKNSDGNPVPRSGWQFGLPKSTNITQPRSDKLTIYVRFKGQTWSEADKAFKDNGTTYDVPFEINYTVLPASMSPTPTPIVTATPTPTPEPEILQGVEITRTLKVQDGETLREVTAEEETAYAAFFTDPECQNLVAGSVMTFTYTYSSSATQKVELEPGTYYISETDKDGNALNSDDYTQTLPESVTVEADKVESLAYNAVYTELPDGFFLQGTLRIRKVVQNQAGEEVNVDGTFHFFISTSDEPDEPASDFVTDTEPAITLEGDSQGYIDVPVKFTLETDEVTLLVQEDEIESDEDLTYVGQSYSDDGVVTATLDGDMAQMTVINICKETESPTATPTTSPTPTEEPEEEEEEEEDDYDPTPTFASSSTRYVTTYPQTIYTNSGSTTYVTSVPQTVQTTTTAQTARTADDTPIALYVLLLALGSLAIMVTAAEKKRKS